MTNIRKRKSPLIEVKEIRNSKKIGLKQEKDYRLFIDGNLIEKASVTARGQKTPSGVWFSVGTNDFEIFSLLASYSYYELPEPIVELTLKPNFNWARFIDEILFMASEKEANEEGVAEFLEVQFNFTPITGWRKPYDPWDYFNELSEVIKKANNPAIEIGLFEEDRGIEAGFYVTFYFASLEIAIANEFARCSDILHHLHNKAEKLLLSSLRADSVMMYFDFPEEVKVPCEQYLLYFGQFLRDLGVEAETALAHEAKQVLFTVTPTDKEQALDNIRTALKIYLHLPSSPIRDATNESIAVQKLESNILRLRSDLKLAAAELQAKNATIQAHELTISIQKGLLSGEIIIDSLKGVTPKLEEKDKEDLFGGTVALKKYDGKFAEVDLPELYRRLKRLFEKKDKEE